MKLNHRHDWRRIWNVSYPLLAWSLIWIMEGANAVGWQTPGGIDKISEIAANNAMLGYDHENHLKKKLLDFVAPVYKEPLVSEKLVASLSVTNPYSTAKQVEVADKIASGTASMIQVEQSARLLEHLVRMRQLDSPGISKMENAIGMESKIISTESRIRLLQSNLASYKEEMQNKREMKQEFLHNRLEVVKAQEIKSVMTKSGKSQNALIDGMRPSLLKYGYSIGDDPNYQGELAGLKMDPADIDKIRLQLDDEGEPVVFSATKGSSDLGKIPMLLNHPQVLPKVKNFESVLESMAGLEEGPEFYTKTRELEAALLKLDEVFDEHIGTRKENAKKGVAKHRVWMLANDYRNRLRGLVNQLELEGNSSILKSPRGRYDIESQGTGILAFTKFIVDNSCKVAPAAIGNEAAYLRFHQLLRQLETIVNQ